MSGNSFMITLPGEVVPGNGGYGGGHGGGAGVGGSGGGGGGGGKNSSVMLGPGGPGQNNSYMALPQPGYTPPQAEPTHTGGASGGGGGGGAATQKHSIVMGQPGSGPPSLMASPQPQPHYGKEQATKTVGGGGNKSIDLIDGGAGQRSISARQQPQPQAGKEQTPKNAAGGGGNKSIDMIDGGAGQRSISARHQLKDVTKEKKTAAPSKADLIKAVKASMMKSVTSKAKPVTSPAKKATANVQLDTGAELEQPPPPTPPPPPPPPPQPEPQPQPASPASPAQGKKKDQKTNQAQKIKSQMESLMKEAMLKSKHEEGTVEKKAPKPEPAAEVPPPINVEPDETPLVPVPNEALSAPKPSRNRFGGRRLPEMNELSKGEKKNLVLEPEKLVFAYPYTEPQDYVLKLTNKSADHIIYKVMTTQPKYYLVKNRMGVIKAGQSSTATIRLEPLTDVETVVKLNHQVMVQTARVENLYTPVEQFWKESDTVKDRVQFLRVRVKLLSDGQEAKPVTTDEEAMPPMKEGIVVEPEEFLIFHGPFTEICTSPICVLNNTDKFMYIKMLVTNPDPFRVKPNAAIINPRAMQVMAAMVEPIKDMPAMEKLKNKFMLVYAESDDSNLSQDVFWKVCSKSSSIKLKAAFTM